MGRPIVVTGPSGAGKSTVCARLRDHFPEWGFSVSATTRAPRGAEQEGVHYHFLTPEAFDAGIRAGDFLEWEEVHGQRYGTRRRELLAALTTHPAVLLDVDPKGGLSIRAAFPDALLLFLKPPSTAAQQERLRTRREDPADAIARRIRRTEAELALARYYDLVVVNEDLEQTMTTIVDFLTRCLEAGEHPHGA